jgi:hypothetical protein
MLVMEKTHEIWIGRLRSRRRGTEKLQPRQPLWDPLKWQLDCQTNMKVQRR